MFYQFSNRSQSGFRLRTPSRLFILILAPFVALGLAAFHVTPAYAADITVDSTADSVASDDACTLREAINNANADADTTGGDCVAGAGDDTITFGVSGTIALGDELTVENQGKLTIDGGGAITVDGGGKTLFIVNAGADATFAGLTLTQAWSAIFNNGGTVTVSNSGTKRSARRKG